MRKYKTGSVLARCIREVTSRETLRSSLVVSLCKVAVPHSWRCSVFWPCRCSEWLAAAQRSGHLLVPGPGGEGWVAPS